jgi:hypothetical protein
VFFVGILFGELIEGKSQRHCFELGHGLSGTPNWSGMGLVTAVEFKAVRGAAPVIL